MPFTVAPDDEVYRFHSAFLGFPELTFPWHVRYLAYWTWFLVFSTILSIEGLLPFISVPIPPMIEFCVSVLVTYAIMLGVDHDRSIGAVVRNIAVVTLTPSPHDTAVRVARPTLRSVKTTKDPL